MVVENAPDALLHGTAFVDCVVGRDGGVEQVLLIKGDAAMDAAVREAVRDWKFRPVLVNGEPYAVRARLEVEY